jgi:hypothetical protein
MELRERLPCQARGHRDAQAAAGRSLQFLTYLAELETEAVHHRAVRHGRSQCRHQIVEHDLVAETQVNIPGRAGLPAVSQFQRKPAFQHPRGLLPIQSLQQSFERDPLLEPLRGNPFLQCAVAEPRQHLLAESRGAGPTIRPRHGQLRSRAAPLAGRDSEVGAPAYRSATRSQARVRLPGLRRARFALGRRHQPRRPRWRARRW